MITATDLVKRYGETTALNGLCMSASQGEILAVLGPNGAGKTTAVNVLSTLIQPDSGTAEIDGFDVVKQGAKVRERIALTGQFAAVDEQLSGYENLVLFGRLRGLSKKAAKTKAVELLNDFDLSNASARRVNEYSGGMRRRLDIAASLVTRPEVLFLDEPTTGLDPRSRSQLWEVVRELRSSGITILLTTQYLEEADLLADRILVIGNGKEVAEGTPDELKDMVGTKSCEVSLIDARQINKAAKLFEGVTGVSVNETLGALSVPAINGVETLAAVLKTLNDNEVEVGDAAIRKPTLDDVYMKLTEASQ